MCMINWVYKCIANNLWKNIFHITIIIISWTQNFVIDDDVNNWGKMYILKNYVFRLDGNNNLEFMHVD
jgi:hypothetical protein